MFDMPLKASITGEVDAIAWLCHGGVTFPSAIFLEGKSASSFHKFGTNIVFSFHLQLGAGKLRKEKKRN
jgi:hypothetical protein